MTIFNATPHTIIIYKQNDCVYNERIRKLLIKDGAKPLVTIAPSGKLLNAELEHMYLEDVDGIPVWVERIVDIDDPEDVFNIQPGDIIIVSRLYAQAHELWISNYRPVYRLACVSQPVYDNVANPRPIGCLGLEIVAS